MGYGKKAARNIDKRLMGVKRFDVASGRSSSTRWSRRRSTSESGRQVPAEVAAAERVKDSREVSLGLTTAAALEETGRCLRCDIRSAER